MTAPAADDAVVEVSPDGADGRSHSICPYLAAAGGTWRAASAQRVHRCGAVDPPAPIAVSKQRQLCLIAVHATCPTYRAAVDAVESAGLARTAARFPIPRTTPVVLDRGRPTLSPAVIARQRGIAQGALLALMGVALVAIVVARIGEPAGSGTAAASPSASTAASPTPHPNPSPSPSPDLSASPSPSPSAAPSPSPSPSPAPRRTYVVKSGDTLSAIAARNGTTVKAIAELNAIADPSLIRVGQVLILP